MVDDMTTWLVRWDSPGDGPRLAVKDAFDVAGTPTTVGSPAVGDDAEPAERDAPVVETARDSGARIVGKTNCTELCRSADGANPWTGTPTNPLDASRLPGGSSSGSAVAVATGQADVGYGSDTGGSVRIPAACCGIAGLLTTRGRISRQGLFPFSATLDAVGPLGADIAAVELGMRLMEPGFAAAPDPGTPAVARLRFPAEAGLEIDPDVDTAVDEALRAAGCSVADERVTDWDSGIDAANTVMLAEGYMAHRHLLDVGDKISYRIRRRIEFGGDVAAESLLEAHDAGRSFRTGLDMLLARHSVLALPTVSGLPPKVGDRDLSLTNLTVPLNLAGLPALALPVPRPNGGLPASLQLVGPEGSEERLLALAAGIEETVGRPAVR